MSSKDGLLSKEPLLQQQQLEEGSAKGDTEEGDVMKQGFVPAQVSGLFV